MFPQIILFQLLFSHILKIQSENALVNKAVKNIVDKISSTGLHLHFIIELDNPINLYISESAPSQQIPFTIYNICPKTLPLIKNKKFEEFLEERKNRVDKDKRYLLLCRH